MNKAIVCDKAPGAIGPYSQAVEAFFTLKNCKECKDCVECVDCEKCSGCIQCENCYECGLLKGASDCESNRYRGWYRD